LVFSAANLNDANVPISPGIKAIHRHPSWNGNLLAGNDIGLIQLSAPATLNPVNNTNHNFKRVTGTASLLLFKEVAIAGYGLTGTGLTGATSLDGYQRAGNNVIDRQGHSIGGSDNIILADFDGPSTSDPNLWGSDTPMFREIAIADIDFGGPWIDEGYIAGITSIREDVPSDEIRYGTYSGAVAVAPHNDWINSTMGGVNWNKRTTVGYTNFSSNQAWGDVEVPSATDDVQFSLPSVPPILYGSPYISFDQNTTVRTMTVEFGPHTFHAGAYTLTTSGAINVDDDGTFVLQGGTVRALPATGLRVGRNSMGRFVQNGGTVDVDQNMYVGTNAGSNGEYELNDAALLVQGILNIGYAGIGTLIQNGGEVDAVTVSIGDLEGSTGRYELNSNDLDVHTLEVGRAGNGRFEQHDGDVYVSTSHMRIGRESTGNGTYEIDGGRLRTAAGLAIYVGFDGVGTLDQSDGTIQGGSSLQLGVTAGGEGSYVAAGGTASFPGGIAVGAFGKGDLQISNNGSVSASLMQVARENGSTGTARLIGGILSISGTISIGPGAGSFDFTGGTLHVGTYNGDLANNGGKLAPGNSAGITQINGNYSQSPAGSLEIEIGGLMAGAEFDQVNVSGIATLDGNLIVSMLNGYAPGSAREFIVFDAASITGQFANVGSGGRVNTVDGLGSFLVHYGSGSPFDPSQIVLSSFAMPILPGDYNNDGTVNAADYTVWRNNLGTSNTLENDPIGGIVGTAQYDQWKANFGMQAGGVGSSGGVAPEPSGLLLTVSAMMLFGPWATMRRIL